MVVAALFNDLSNAHRRPFRREILLQHQAEAQLAKLNGGRSDSLRIVIFNFRFPCKIASQRIRRVLKRHRLATIAASGNGQTTLVRSVLLGTSSGAGPCCG